MDSRVFARCRSACGRGSERLEAASAARSATKPRAGQISKGCCAEGWGLGVVACTGTGGTGVAVNWVGIAVGGGVGVTVCVAIGVRVGVSVGVWLTFGDDKGDGVELGRTGFAVGRAIVGMGEGIEVGLGGGTWTVPRASPVFPSMSQAEASTG